MLKPPFMTEHFALHPASPQQPAFFDSCLAVLSQPLQSFMPCIGICDMCISSAIGQGKCDAACAGIPARTMLIESMVIKVCLSQFIRSILSETCFLSIANGEANNV